MAFRAVCLGAPVMDPPGKRAMMAFSGVMVSRSLAVMVETRWERWA